MKNYWIRDWLVRYEDEEGKGIKDAERKEALKAVSLFLILCFTLNFAYFKLATNNTRRDYHLLSCIIPTLFGLNAEANGTFVL